MKKTIKNKKTWNKSKRCKSIKKYKKGGSNTSGAILQLNVNSDLYRFPIYYFPEAIDISNNMNNGNNNLKPYWNNWFQNYINNNNPNSNYGSLTLEQTLI